MSTLDGLPLDVAVNKQQIVDLAHFHRKKLDEAIFHQEIHLGDYCLAQRKRVYDFTRQLSVAERAEFYQIYNGELKQIAADEALHPADAEQGVSVFIIFITLAIIALILYFAIIRNIVH